MRLIMNPGHEYVIYNRTVSAGDEFEVPDNEAELWMHLGRARRLPVARLRKEDHAGRYLRSDMRAEDE